MLLNLMAALSLASIGAVAGIASKSQLVDGAELDKSYLIERKNAVAYVNEGYSYPCYYNYHGSMSSDVFFDDTIFYTDGTYPISYGPACLSPYGACLRYASTGYLIVSVAFDPAGFDLASSANLIANYNYYFDGHPCVYNNLNSLLAADGRDDLCVNLTLALEHSENSWNLGYESYKPYRLTILKSTYTYDAYMADHSIVGGIASGLTSVQHYATSLVSGFDALALDNGALTNSMAFAFTLLGIGTAVGICKLTFNWITGRHGM